MAIETGMYGKNPIDTFSSSFERGARLGELSRQSSERDQLKGILAKHTKQNEDGSVSVDRQGYLGELSTYDPEKALSAQKQFAEQDKLNVEAQNAKIKQAYEQSKMASSLLSGVKDQATYDLALSQGQKMGLMKPGELPPQYDPTMVSNLAGQFTTQTEKLDLAIKNAGLAKTNAETAKLKRETSELGGGPGGGGYPNKITEAQSKALGFGRRAMIADQMLEKVMSDPKADVTSLKTQVKSALPKWAGGVKNQTEQSLMTAKISFIASVLRKESGAAVTKDEFDKYDAIYFPQAGENPETLEEKKVLRKNFIDTERLTAGNAWRDPITATKGTTGSWDTPKVGAAVDGYVFKGGNPADKNSWEKAK